MDKLLVELLVPAINLSIDVVLPSSMRVEDAVELLAEATAKASRGFYKPTGSEVVCVKRLDRALIPGTDIAQYGLMNSDKLVMI